MEIDERYKAVHDPISRAPPTKQDLKVDATLRAYMEENIKLETMSEMNRRNEILAEVKSIFCEWVKYVAVEVLHIPEEEAVEAGGELFISGSHKLGVREPNADIDTVCVAPHFCTREHFFSSLKNKLLAHPDVKELNAIETAAIPLIAFEFRNVSIDLLFAQLAQNVVPRDLDILDDKILQGVDDGTEKSLNGPRVTNMLTKLLGAQAFDNFLVVLRCVRKWAKARGVYGNKLGYLGGVNWNILVAFICQLYPSATPTSLLYKFFVIYSTRDWGNTPVQLNRIQPNPPGEQRTIWSREKNYDVMSIITPAYPAMNSTYSVSTYSLKVMVDEFKRGREVVKTILDTGGKNWGKLFEPSDFFVKYSHYVGCNIIGSGDDTASRSWLGFVESRLRKLPSYFGSNDGLTCIHLYVAVYRLKKSPNAWTYFIGFDVNHAKLKNVANKTIRLEDAVSRFWSSDLWKYSGEQNDSLDFTVEYFKWGYLPREVFDSVGGVDAAKAIRAELANTLKMRKETAPSITTGTEKSAAVSIELGTSGLDREDAALSETGNFTVTKKRQQNEEGSVDLLLQDAKSIIRLVPPNKVLKMNHLFMKTPMILSWNVLLDAKEKEK